MSSRVSRKTTVTSMSSSSSRSASAADTPEQSSSGYRARSPLSPTRMSRLQEKEEMVNLNDRLAVYMETVRNLENENARLVKEVRVTEETIYKERETYRLMYQQELTEARRLLDEVASDKARCEIENKRYREENEELKSSNDKLLKENRQLETSLNLAENRFADLQTKYNKAVADGRDAERLRKALDSQKKYVENETLARVELENKLQTLKEEANFRDQMHQQEVKQLQTRRREEITEIDGRLTVEYENKLQAALKELREQHEQQLLANREEVTELYEKKIAGMTAYYSKNTAAANNALDELRIIQSRYDEIHGQVSALEAANAALNSRIRELEKLLDLERTRGAERLAQVEQELDRTREEMNLQLKEYQDLMDIKIALDTEISAYRKMLEFEESRLKITPGVVTTPPTRRMTPSRRAGTPLGIKQATKRRRVILDETEQLESFQISGEAKGDVVVKDVDPEGKFIILENGSTKEVSIGGWSLKHRVGEQETTFKFHRSLKIEPKGIVTVWGADAGKTHEPPQNIVMKQKWFVGDESATTLLNGSGEEVATRQRQRVQYSSTSYRQDGSQDELDANDPQREQCFLM